MKYRKKPVVIDASQFIHGNVTPQWLGEQIDEGKIHLNNNGTLSIVTLEGIMTAEQGDWIIKGVKGEIYPCKPDIFDATYEPE